MIDEVSELYQVAPKEFTAARNALAKELKAAGRKDDAAVVAKMRRPRLAEHALNLAASADPDAVDAFAKALDAAGAAQRRAIEKGDGGGLRAATDALRSATAKVVTAAVRALDDAGESGAAQRAELNDLLRGMLSNDAVTLLRAGVLGSAEPGDAATMEGEPPAAPRRPEKAATAAKPERVAKKAKSAKTEPASTTSIAERRDAARLAKEAATARRRRERDLQIAEGRRDTLKRDVARARKAVEAAESALEDAESALGAAEEQVETLRSELDD